MKLRILTACAITALAVGTGASAQELPAWDPQTICTEDATPQYCGFLEGQARAQISQQWEFIPTLVRERCLKQSADEETDSWRLFGDCIADAARKPGSGEATAAVAGSDDGGSGDGGSDDGAAAEARVAELEAELEKAKAGNRSSEVRIDGLQKRLMTATAAAGAAAAVAVAPAAATEGGGDTEALQAAIDKAESRARGAEFRTDALQTTLKEIIASSKATKAEDDAALEKSETDLKRSNARIEGLQQRLLAAREEADAASSASGDGSERITELEKALAEAETESKRSAARISGLQERLMAANEAMAAPSEDAGSDDRIAELQAELDQAKAGIRSGEVRIEGLQKRLVDTMKMAEGATSGDGEADERITALEADLAKANAGVRSGEARIEGLQQRLMAANEGAASAGAPAEGGDDVAGLQRQLDTARSRIENMQIRMRRSRDSLGATKDESASYARNLDGARTRIMALQDAMMTSRTASQDEIEGLKAELAAMKEASSGAASEGADAVAASQGLQRLLDNQRERSERVAATVSEQRARIEDLEGELGTLRRAADMAGTRSCQQRMNDVVGGGGIQFANNKADIRADAAQTIDRLISIAKDCDDVRITVRGHTDAMGDRAYNLGLSQRRADAVVAYMGRNGISPDNVNAIGVGPDEPVADNNTRAGRAQNRRIEIVVQ